MSFLTRTSRRLFATTLTRPRPLFRTALPCRFASTDTAHVKAADNAPHFTPDNVPKISDYAQQHQDASLEEIAAIREAADERERRYGYNSPDTNFDDNRLDPDQLSDPTNRTYTYLMTAAGVAIYASVGRVLVQSVVSTMSASADTLALATVEVDVSAINEGMATTVKWRGKPVFIRYRTPREIEAAQADDHAALRDPETDAERFPQNNKLIVLVGVCTHLGCVPMNAQGDYGGWFCPCHGSHYDTSGRIRKGPSPLNLEVPKYKFLSEKKILLG